MAIQREFEFKYEGGDTIDVNTLLTSQFHFLAIINEIQRELHADSQISIKIKAFTPGSFVVQLVIEASWVANLFTVPNATLLLDTVATFASIVELHKMLKGKKATHVQEKGDHLEIKSAGQTIQIQNAVFNIYKNNNVVNGAIQKNFEMLDQDEDVKGITIRDSKTKKRILNVARKDFADLSTPNSYLSRDTTEEIHPEETLFIKKPHLFPEKNKVWVWEFIHKGRDIKAKISSAELKRAVDEGFKVGQGDRLVGDLKIGYKWNEKFMTYVEDNRFELVKVHYFIERSKQQKIKFDQY